MGSSCARDVSLINLDRALLIVTEQIHLRHVFRVPVQHTFALGPEEDAWRLVLTGFLGYGHFSFETNVFGPKVTASEDFLFVLPQAELQIPLRRWWTVKSFVAAGLRTQQVHGHQARQNFT